MSDAENMISEGGPVNPGEDDMSGLKELIQAASQGPVAEMTPYGILVTLFIPWSRASSMLGDEEKE